MGGKDPALPNEDNQGAEAEQQPADLAQRVASVVGFEEIVHRSPLLPASVDGDLRARPYPVGLSFKSVMRSYALCTTERSSCPLFTSLTTWPKALADVLVWVA